MTTWDVAIVGGGLAGLSAANQVAQLGATVRVFEQGEEENYPCNSRYAGGFLHMAFTDANLPPAQYADAVHDRCPLDVDRSLVRAVAAELPDTVKWLVATARIRTLRAGPQGWQRWCLAPPRPLRPGLVWLGRGPDMLLRGLERALAVSGGAIERAAEVVDLGRSVRGEYMIVVRTPAGIQEHSARAVVIADGGFQADPGLFGEYVAPTVAAVMQRNAQTGRGFGLRMALKLGLKISHLKHFYGHLLSADAFSNPSLWPYPMIDDLAAAGIIVNRRGERWLDESAGGVHIANELASSTDPLDAFVIIDDKIWESEGRRTRIPCNPILVSNRATMFTADTIEGLAALAGIASDTLTASAARHGRLSTPPYRAIPICAGVTYTMGGIGIDAMARAVDEEGQPVGGLYAAGSSTGGLEGGDTTFYLGGLAKAAVLGRLGGRHAACFATSLQ